MQQVFSGPRPLTHTLRKVLKPIFRRRSFTEASIILDWPQIMNAEWAQRCYPERLIFPRGKKEGGTLVIAVDSGSSLLVQHSEKLLIEWINTYFGYQAVQRLKLKHSYVPLNKKHSENFISQSLFDYDESSEDLSNIQDPELKEALINFQKTYQHYQKHRTPK